MSIKATKLGTRNEENRKMNKRKKAMEKILDRDHRSSIKWWTNNLLVVKEALKTGKLIDGTKMTEKDRAQFEGFEGFIQDNLHMIREHIDGLVEFGDIAGEAIGKWMSGIDEDAVLRDFSAKADELTKIKNVEKQEREKWR